MERNIVFVAFCTLSACVENFVIVDIVLWHYQLFYLLVCDCTQVAFIAVVNK